MLVCPKTLKPLAAAASLALAALSGAHAQTAPAADTTATVTILTNIATPAAIILLTFISISDSFV
jgi:hypothetical protein